MSERKITVKGGAGCTRNELNAVIGQAMMKAGAAVEGEVYGMHTLHDDECPILLEHRGKSICTCREIWVILTHYESEPDA